MGLKSFRASGLGRNFGEIHILRRVRWAEGSCVRVLEESLRLLQGFHQKRVLDWGYCLRSAEVKWMRHLGFRVLGVAGGFGFCLAAALVFGFEGRAFVLNV